MYTWRSQAFSKEFRAQAIEAAKRQIECFRQYTPEMFCRINDCPSNVIDYGYRWKDAEQVFQAMVMRLERRMAEERGPGVMTDEEVKSIEKMFLANPYLFDIAAGDGIRGAASCDDYYLNEKSWD